MAKKVKVKIPLERGKKPVPQFVSVNDYTCMIEPGKDVEVPDFVAEVLRRRDDMLIYGAQFAESVQS